MVKYHRYKIYDYFTARAIGFPLLLGLVVLGLFRQPWNNRRIGREMVLVVMAGSVAFVVATSAAGAFRYFLPIVPLLLLWASKGLDELRQWIMHWELLRNKRSSHRHLYATALQLCALAPMITLSSHGVAKADLFAYEHSATAIAERDAALWLAHYDPGPKRIGVRYAVIPYYARGTLIGLPYGDSEATMRYLVRQKVDFIVLESDYVQQLPAIEKWLADGIPDARARLIYDRTNSSGERVVIYRWDDHLS